MRKLYRIQLVLIAIGFLISAYLQYLYSQPVEIGCTLTGCETVRESPFSTFLGVSMPIWGMLFFFGLGIVTFLSIKPELARYFKLAMIVAGFLFAIYLTYLEAFVIQAFCQWCLIIAISSLLLFGTLIFELIQIRKNARKSN